MSQHFLFVYGTLKRGDVRHFLLQGEKRYCEAVTLHPHRLFNCGTYPGLVPCRSGLQIRGEVYVVNDECLTACDEAEGVAAGLYARRMISVRPVNDKNALDAWAYLYLRSTKGLPDCGVTWSRDMSAGNEQDEAGN